VGGNAQIQEPMAHLSLHGASLVLLPR
jgi:hypothetical protein